VVVQQVLLLVHDHAHRLVQCQQLAAQVGGAAAAAGAAGGATRRPQRRMQDL
jgi:hypothetical protein